MAPPPGPRTERRRSAGRAARAARLGWLVGALLACSKPAPEGSDRAAPSGGGAPGPAASRTPLVVFAASSLGEAFADLEQSFEAAHGDVDVTLSYAGSQVLKLQIREGAPSDVFASADDAHMRELVRAGHAEPSQTFAYNELAIAIPADNPARIAELSDLPRAERLVIGAANVPIGSYTRELFARAGRVYGASFEQALLGRVVSEESNVRLVRAKVELGEADAAVVYRTDALASARVKPVAIPAELNVRAHYPIAVLTRAAHPEAARRWVDHVLSPAGKAALAARGFLVDGDSVARGTP